MARVVQESAQDWCTLMQLPHAAGGRWQDISSSMNGAIDAVLRTNLRATQELLNMASPAKMAEMHQRFIRDYLNALLEGSTAIVRAVHTSLEQTLGPLEQRAAQRVSQQAAHSDRRERVADVMERNVRVANPDDNVQQAARMMLETDAGFLPVGEGDRLVGMLTDRDVTVRLVAEGRDPAHTKVREVMTSDVRYVFDDEPLEHVAENMAERRVRSLPVMNRGKRLVGVVTLGDVAQGSEPREVSPGK